MRRLAIIALSLACTLLQGCGGVYFVGFVSNPGGSTSVNGIVIAVTSGFVSDPTGMITPFTAVTFTNASGAMTVNFCGDQNQWFPMNQHIRAEYTAGVLCNILQNVTVDNQ